MKYEEIKACLFILEQKIPFHISTWNDKKKYFRKDKNTTLEKSFLICFLGFYINKYGVECGESDDIYLIFH